MNGFIWAVILVGGVYSIKQAFQTFERDMRNDANVYLMVFCIGIIVFHLVTKYYE